MKQCSNLQERIQLLKTIAVVFFFTVFSGCASSSTIITGNVRPAVSPSEVKIYIDPPTQYETIGVVEASSAVEFSRQAAQDRVINRLKSKAAKIGANGVLLTTAGSESSGMTGFFSNGIFYAGTSSKIIAQGRAIYVTQE